MIYADFFVNGSVITGFRISGHSDYADEGQDIVCAAVSAMSYLTANTVTEVIGVQADVSVEDGFMSLKTDAGKEEKCEYLLRGFYLQMKELEKQYPQFIRIKEV